MKDFFENIDDYVKGKLDSSENALFEVAMQADENLRKEVEFRQHLLKTLKWKKRLSIAHDTLLQKAKLKNLSENSPIEPSIVKLNYSSPWKRIMAYAATLLIGVLLGWMVFGNALNNDSQSTYGGTGQESTLYDEKTILFKVSLNDNALIITDSNHIHLLITGKENFEKKYKLTPNNLEIFTEVGGPLATNLEGSEIQLFLQKINQFNLQIAFLKINNMHYQIPLSNEDFKILFN